MQVKLPPVAIETEEENKEHLLAGERRRKRYMCRAELIVESKLLPSYMHYRVTYAKDLEQLLTKFQRFKITTST